LRNPPQVSVMIGSCFFLTAIFASSFAQQDWIGLATNVVDVSAKGNEVWLVDDEKQVWRVESNSLRMTHIPGVDAKSLSASSDGWAWVIDTNGTIQRYNVDGNRWEVMPGSGLVQINSITKDLAVGVNAQMNIFVFDVNAWAPFTKGGGKWTAIGEQRDWWIIGGDDYVYHYTTTPVNPAIAPWDKYQIKATNIDVQSPSRVIVTGKDDGKLYVLENNDWKSLVDGDAKRGTLSQSHFFKVTAANELYVGKSANPLDDIFFESDNF